MTVTDPDPLSELAPVSDLIHSARVDGVPVLYARRDGPVTAGLIFRVGRADENVPTSGITHLIEHLALFGQAATVAHHNGLTSDTYTHFHATGNEAEIVDYLNGVCARLRQLPAHRIETEKEILRTEASGRNTRVADHQNLERYGARGPGVSAQGEVGLSAIGEADVIEWARARFTRDNSVLWVTTDHVPDGLDLTLPAGVRIPVPRPRETRIVKPAYFVGSTGGVTLDAVVPRSSAASAFAKVMTDALYRELRVDGGHSYAADCSYNPIDAELASITVFADALTDQQPAVIGGLIDVLAAIRAGTIDERDLNSARHSTSQLFDLPSPGAAMLPVTALNLLYGKAQIHPRDLIAETEAITAAEVARVADLVWSDALVQLPEGDLEWAGFTPTDRWSRSVVDGYSYPWIDDPGLSIIIGDDGVSFRTPDGAATVLFDECAAYLTRPDGARTLIGDDAFRVVIEPTVLNGLTAEAMAALDTRIRPDLVIPMPARKSEDIPQPKPAAPAKRAKPRRWRGFGTWATVLAVVLFLMVPFMYVFTIVDTVNLGIVQRGGGVVELDDLIVGWSITLISTAVLIALVIGVVRRSRWNEADRDRERSIGP